MVKRHAVVDFEGHVGATRDRVQFRATGGAEHHRAGIEEVVDGQHDRSAGDDEPEATYEAMAREQLDAVSPIEDLDPASFVLLRVVVS
jgi:hypothetical protein